MPSILIIAVKNCVYQGDKMDRHILGKHGELLKMKNLPNSLNQDKFDCLILLLRFNITVK